jgi:hypothetical protein
MRALSPTFGYNDSMHFALGRFIAAIPALAVLASCGDEASPPWGSEATGSIHGGQPLMTAAVDCTKTDACSTWSYLYACYFGPTASTHGGGCSAQSACHGTSTSTGTTASGFICGNSKDACWQGMTKSANQFLPTLVKHGATNQYLYMVLYQDGTMFQPSADNMPTSSATLGAPPVMPGFKPAEMACIKSWVAAGAQND